MDPDEFKLKVTRLLLWAVVAVVLIVAGCDSYQVKVFTDAGFCRGTVQGHNGLTWLKCK